MYEKELGMIKNELALRNEELRGIQCLNDENQNEYRKTLEELDQVKSILQKKYMLEIPSDESYSRSQTSRQVSSTQTECDENPFQIFTNGITDLKTWFVNFKYDVENKLAVVTKKQEDFEISKHHVTFKGDDKSGYHWDDLGTTFRPSHSAQDPVPQPPPLTRQADLVSNHNGLSSNVTVRARKPSSLYVPPFKRDNYKSGNLTYTRNDHSPDQHSPDDSMGGNLRSEYNKRPSPRLTSTAVKTKSRRLEQYSSDESFSTSRRSQEPTHYSNNSRFNSNYRPPKPKV
jgi:hypothetical protein